MYILEFQFLFVVFTDSAFHMVSPHKQFHIKQHSSILFYCKYELLHLYIICFPAVVLIQMNQRN